MKAHVVKRLWPLLLAFSFLAGGEEKTYLTGNLSEVFDLRVNIGFPEGPSHLYYVYRIQADKSTYSVSIGRLPGELGWRVHSSIQFRVQKETIFLKCPDGKEWKAKLLKWTDFPPNSPLPTSQSGVPPFVLVPVVDEAPPLRPTLRPGIMPMGISAFRHGDRCAVFRAGLKSGEFFKYLKIRNTPNGREFHIKSHSVALFPDRMTVQVLASTLSCTSSDYPEETNDVQPNFQFDVNFIRSLSFKGFWKRGFDEQNADIRVLTEAQVQVPLRSEETSVEYEIEVFTRDVPLSDTLVICILSPDGKLVTRLSARV